MIHQDIIDFQNKAIALDEKARSFSPGYYYNMQKGSLFLFDNYCPKRIPDVEDEEVLFWYFIIDLYGLFLDAGKYLKFIKKNDASWEKVRLFYDALNELRSVFCHNKPSAAFLPFVFDKQTLFGKIQDWKNRIKPLQNLVNPQSTLNKQDYHDLFDIFLCCANNILNTIETELLKEYEMYYNSKDDGQIRDKWFLELFRMFYNSESAYTRAYYEYMTGPFYPYQKASVRKIKSLFVLHAGILFCRQFVDANVVVVRQTYLENLFSLLVRIRGIWMKILSSCSHRPHDTLCGYAPHYKIFALVDLVRDAAMRYKRGVGIPRHREWRAQVYYHPVRWRVGGPRLHNGTCSSRDLLSRPVRLGMPDDRAMLTFARNIDLPMDVARDSSEVLRTNGDPCSLASGVGVRLDGNRNYGGSSRQLVGY